MWGIYNAPLQTVICYELINGKIIINQPYIDNKTANPQRIINLSANLNLNTAKP